MTRQEFEDAATKLRPRLVGYIESLGRGPGDAEDIVQEALLQLIPKYEKFVGNNEWAIRAWFRKAVKITNKRFGRKAGKDEQYMSYGQELQRSIKDEDVDPHELWDPKDPKTRRDPCERISAHAAVDKALRNLRPEIRDAIWQVHAEGATVKEVAEGLGRKERTTQAMLRPHLETLRERLKDFAQTLVRKSRVD